MSIVQKIHKGNLIRYDRLISLYPPFLLLGAKIRISKDYRRIKLIQKLRWYNKNNNGVLFGGAICMLSDPFPALVFEKIIDGCSAWNKKQSVDYLIPARSSVEAVIELNESDIQEIQNQLTEHGKAEKNFEYFFIDKKGRKVAKVSNTIYLKMHKKSTLPVNTRKS